MNLEYSRNIGIYIIPLTISGEYNVIKNYFVAVYTKIDSKMAQSKFDCICYIINLPLLYGMVKLIPETKNTSENKVMRIYCYKILKSFAS